MGTYKVRANQSIGRNGKDFVGGDVIELDERMAAELSHKVDPCDAKGNVLPKEQAVFSQLDSAREHERESILLSERDRLVAAIAEIDKKLAEMRAPATPADKKKAHQ